MFVMLRSDWPVQGRARLLPGTATKLVLAPGYIVPGSATAGLPGPLGGRETTFPLRIKYGERPAGSLSKNTAKRLDVHAGSLLDAAFLQVPTIASPYVPGQEVC